MSLTLAWSSLHSNKQDFWFQVQGTFKLLLELKAAASLKKQIYRFAIGFICLVILMSIFLISSIQTIFDRHFVTWKVSLNV